MDACLRLWMTDTTHVPTLHLQAQKTDKDSECRELAELCSMLLQVDSKSQSIRRLPFIHRRGITGSMLLLLKPALHLSNKLDSFIDS